jgi:hypothetical protein
MKVFGNRILRILGPKKKGQENGECYTAESFITRHLRQILPSSNQGGRDGACSMHGTEEKQIQFWSREI